MDLLSYLFLKVIVSIFIYLFSKCKAGNDMIFGSYNRADSHWII
jgi:hypothetical protein